MKVMNTGGSKHIMENFDDMKQDLHVHILTKVLPIIDVTKVQAIQNLIYISAKHKLINLLKSLDSRNKIRYDYNEYNLKDEALFEDNELSNDAVVLLINDRIDELINQQVNINCVASVYLQLLKNYIIDNDYNAEGFKEHCMKMMKIGNSQFLNLSHKFGFKTPAFKIKKVK